MRKKVAATLFITTKAQQDGTKDQQRYTCLPFHSSCHPAKDMAWFVWNISTTLLDIAFSSSDPLPQSIAIMFAGCMIRSYTCVIQRQKGTNVVHNYTHLRRQSNG